MQNREEIEGLLKDIIADAVDGHETPHQEVFNKTRYREILDKARPALQLMERARTERVKLEALKDADYVDAYLARSEKTVTDPNNLLLTLEGRHMLMMMASMGLSKSAGGIADVVSDQVFGGAGIGRDGLVNELGNLMWHVFVILREHDIPLEDVLFTNLSKLDRKHPNAGVMSVEVEVDG